VNICLECGQCCQHFRVSFYQGEVQGSGYGTVPANLITPITPHLACMKGTEKGGGRCAALTHSDADGYRCSIYENRPSPCREFNVYLENGELNPGCQKLRARVGLLALK